MKLVLAADHGGFELKNQLAAALTAAGHEVTDLGTNEPASVDYPDYAHRAAKAILDGTHERGILVCGSGVGMSLAANRHPGIRAVVCSDTYTARLSREHNDANILALGQRVVGPGLAKDIVDAWLGAKFEGGRHSKRVEKIELPRYK